MVTPTSLSNISVSTPAKWRRKKATGKTIGTLKAWLKEHTKNPYPTKKETIMLAKVTKMTKRQVTTWFTNARRRLRKEKKMTLFKRKRRREKKLEEGDYCVASKRDIECKNVDVVVYSESLLLEEKEASSTKKTYSTSQLERTFDELDNEVETSSLVRDAGSPTFNEIRHRFSGKESPTSDLQKWIDGCLQNEATDELCDYRLELPPRTTPTANKITTFSSQKLFEAFDKAKTTNLEEKRITEESSYDCEPLSMIFLSQQPVCSTKVTRESVINLDSKTEEKQ